MNDTASHPTEPASGAQPVYDNRSLFSDYYLRERLSDHAVWSEGVTPAFEAARRLYLDKREMLAGADEASTEYEFIRPLLENVLGYQLDVQPRATRQGRLNRPDYALFTSPQAKADALHHRDDEGAYFARAAAVADARFWGRPLDRQIEEARDTLIDQIVYRLYGLTEEEVAVVEGKGGE